MEDLEIYKQLYLVSAFSHFCYSADEIYGIESQN